MIQARRSWPVGSVAPISMTAAPALDQLATFVSDRYRDVDLHRQIALYCSPTMLK